MPNRDHVSAESCCWHSMSLVPRWCNGSMLASSTRRCRFDSGSWLPQNERQIRCPCRCHPGMTTQGRSSSHGRRRNLPAMFCLRTLCVDEASRSTRLRDTAGKTGGVHAPPVRRPAHTSGRHQSPETDGTNAAISASSRARTSSGPTPVAARSASVTAPWRFARRSPSSASINGTCMYMGVGRPSNR